MSREMHGLKAELRMPGTRCGPRAASTPWGRLLETRPPLPALLLLNQSRVCHGSLRGCGAYPQEGAGTLATEEIPSPPRAHLVVLPGRKST